MSSLVEVEYELLDRAIRASDEVSAEAVVRRALEEFIGTHQPHPLVELFGALDFDPEFDYKVDRSRTS